MKSVWSLLILALILAGCGNNVSEQAMEMPEVAEAEPIQVPLPSDFRSKPYDQCVYRPNHIGESILQKVITKVVSSGQGDVKILSNYQGLEVLSVQTFDTAYSREMRLSNPVNDRYVQVSIPRGLVRTTWDYSNEISLCNYSYDYEIVLKQDGRELYSQPSFFFSSLFFSPKSGELYLRFPPCVDTARVFVTITRPTESMDEIEMVLQAFKQYHHENPDKMFEANFAYGVLGEEVRIIDTVLVRRDIKRIMRSAPFPAPDLRVNFLVVRRPLEGRTYDIIDIKGENYVLVDALEYEIKDRYPKSIFGYLKANAEVTTQPRISMAP